MLHIPCAENYQSLAEKFANLIKIQSIIWMEKEAPH